MVDMSGDRQSAMRSRSASKRAEIDQYSLGLAVCSVLLAVPFGLALDYGHWWLGVPASLATLLMVGVFARRHIFGAQPKPLIGQG